MSEFLIPSDEAPHPSVLQQPTKKWVPWISYKIGFQPDWALLVTLLLGLWRTLNCELLVNTSLIMRGGILLRGELLGKNYDDSSVWLLLIGSCLHNNCYCSASCIQLYRIQIRRNMQLSNFVPTHTCSHGNALCPLASTINFSIKCFRSGLLWLLPRRERL